MLLANWWIFWEGHLVDYCDLTIVASMDLVKGITDDIINLKTNPQEMELIHYKHISDFDYSTCLQKAMLQWMTSKKKIFNRLRLLSELL